MVECMISCVTAVSGLPFLSGCVKLARCCAISPYNSWCAVVKYDVENREAISANTMPNTTRSPVNTAVIFQNNKLPFIFFTGIVSIFISVK